ncbi:MAG: DNA-binding protein WhiA [Mogibacterium sp.]|nr:DNA-binding protein WhiA [Mogibacterium sp.]
MSYSLDVKNELAHNEPAKKCCMLAEIAGFLRAAGSLKLHIGDEFSGKYSIIASTENPAIARHYYKLIKTYFGSNATSGVGSSAIPGKAHEKSHRYYLTISPDQKSMQILRECGMMLIKEGDDYLTDGIYSQIVRTKCCKKSYIRGVFLGCGSVSDPKKGYHLEFVLGSEQLANDLKKLIGSFVDLSANVTVRKEDYIVYMKRANYISDLLGIMGADAAMLEFENVRVGKSVRHETQRILNCDSANVDRTLTASEEQQQWIKTLKDAGVYDNLPAPLKSVAELRLLRPEASLTEIGEALNPPIRKPGVSKRFAKLKELATAVEEESADEE